MTFIVTQASIVQALAKNETRQTLNAPPSGVMQSLRFDQTAKTVVAC
ncbi:MAG TPA: hypothetical protein VG962_15140 [Steroidobacteraceae bacterium]|nr:hypothetical protein [Steroidobacteraceae bacterium]